MLLSASALHGRQSAFHGADTGFAARHRRSSRSRSEFSIVAGESFVALIDSRYLLIEAWIFFGQRSISTIETRIFLVEACVLCSHPFIAPIR